MKEKNSLTKFTIEEGRQLAMSSKKLVRLRDEKTRGLVVQITAGGTVTFYVRRKSQSREIWERLGEYGDHAHQLTIDQARQQAYKVLSLLQSGYNPQQERQNKQAAPTLRLLFEQYLDDHAKTSRKTWRQMQQSFELYVGEQAKIKLADRKAEDVTYADIKRLKDSLAHVPYAANRTLQLLRAVYNKAIAWRRYRGDNPVQGISLYKETPRARFLTADEIEQFMIALNQEPIRDTKDFVMLSVLTGARKTNILAMRFSQIDFAHATWLIPETKNGTSQMVALTGNEVKILLSRLDYLQQQQIGSDFVFPGVGRSGHLQDMKRSWVSLRNRAKLPDVTIHDLRRNLGHWMASENVNMALVKGALNHKDMKTTLNVYAKTAKESEREARLIGHAAMFAAAGKAGLDLLKGADTELNSSRAQKRKRARNYK